MNGLTDKDLKQQIDSAEHTPGVNYDKNAAWDKLQLRMNSPRMKTVIYYRITAAAVVFILLCIGFWVKQSLHPISDTPTIAAIQVAPTTTTPTIPHTTTSFPTIVPKATKKQNKKNAAIPLMVNNSEPHTEPTHSAQVEPAPPSAPVPVITVAIAKPKLKVVHINDVYDEPMPYRSEKQDIFLTIISPEVLRKHTKPFLTQSSNNKTTILNNKN